MSRMIEQRRQVSPGETPHWLVWRNTVANAAAQFESRWTYSALRHVDEELAGKLNQQQGLFDRALIARQSDASIVKHGEAMLRGYARATAAMEASDRGDDAYKVYHRKDGLKIVIGFNKAPAEFLLKQLGSNTVFLTAIEAAELLGGWSGFQAIVEAKLRWPMASVEQVKKKSEAK